MITITPTASLTAASTYTLELFTGVTSTTGTALGATYTTTFTTAGTPPVFTVSSTDPTAGAIGVAVTKVITVTMSLAIVRLE